MKPGPEDHFGTLLSSLYNLQDKGCCTDLILQAGGGEVRCHKAMVAPLFPLLWDLCSTLEETEITLAGVRLQVVQQLIKLVYTGIKV